MTAHRRPQGPRRDAPAWTKIEMIIDPGERERFKAAAHGAQSRGPGRHQRRAGDVRGYRPCEATIPGAAQRATVRRSSAAPREPVTTGVTRSPTPLQVPGSRTGENTLAETCDVTLRAQRQASVIEKRRAETWRCTEPRCSRSRIGNHDRLTRRLRETRLAACIRRRA